MLAQLLYLELKLKLRDLYQLALPGVFVLVFALLFPLALTPEKALLTQLAPGICWLALLVSLLLHLDRFFRDDYEQGTLDLLLSGTLGSGVLIARMLAHWLAIALPLCVLSSIVGFTFGLTGISLLQLFAALTAGSAVMVFLGATIASLCSGTSRSGMLIAILLVPLLTPVVVFGVEASSQNDNGWSLVILLAGLAAINLVVAPLICHAALRSVID